MSEHFETIGPYKIEGVLGHGGMGSVYKGVHAKSGDVVAIKVISSAMAQHARFRRRFDAEIQTLLRLKHPNIVQLIGFGEEKGLLFYSMEYVDGDNVHQILRREKRIAWPKVLDWAIEISSALKHAHDLGIIHRDLKPANLMVARDGQIKLMDFGIAKLFGASEQTVPGSVLGTADFMSPEQAESKPVTVRSDLYSLGVICYSLLAGKTPFTGSNVPEILFNVRYGSATPLRELAPETPTEFCDLIGELLRRDPSQRPPTAIVVNKRLESMRVGLSRTGGTSTQVGSVTIPSEASPELTSLDINDDPSIALMRNDFPPTHMVGRGNPLTVAQGGAQGAPPSPRGKPIAAAGPHEDTQLASDRSEPSVPDIPSGIGEIRSTNYTQVTDSDRKRSRLVLTEEPEPAGHTQWLGIGGIVAALLGCLLAVYWFSRTPTADALYQPIAAALSSEDRAGLEAVEDTARRFLELYPEDARAPQVAVELESLQVDRMIRQLQRRRDRRSSAGLDALEQAFIDCSQAAETNPEEAKRKLSALLTVFPVTDDMSLRHRKLVAAAQQMLDRMASDRNAEDRSVAFESLQTQMRWSETHLTPEARRAWLQSMIELYQEKPWASELVAQAKRMVDMGP